MWLAPEHVVDRSVSDVVEMVNDYKRLLLRTPPVEGAGTSYKAIMVVLTDIPADRAKVYADDAQTQKLNQPLYAEDGVVFGQFYQGNDGSAVYNPSFKPFRAPVPFLLLRHAVVSDWKFFLDNEDWLAIWAHRFGESAVTALAQELRQTNWRQRQLASG